MFAFSLRDFPPLPQTSGEFDAKRLQQKMNAMWTIATDTLVESFKQDKNVQGQLGVLEAQLLAGKITAGWAADQLVAAFNRRTDAKV